MEINRIDSQAAQWQAAQLEKQANKQSIEEAEQQATKVQGKPPAGGGGQKSDGVSQKTAQASQTTSVDVSSLTGSADDDDDSAYQAIVNKVNSGQALTSSELSTLRSKNATLYAQAVQAQQMRSQLKEQMEANPSQAGKAARQAISEEEDPAMRQALDTEYQQFAMKYDQVALSGQLFK